MLNDQDLHKWPKYPAIKAYKVLTEYLKPIKLAIYNMSAKLDFF